VGRVLGIDWGTKRHGVALSDGMRIAARGLTTLERPRTRAAEFDALAALCAEHEVAQVVVGLPFHMDGRPGDHAEDIARWAHALAGRLGLPVELADERRTTLAAQDHLRSMGVKGKAQKGRVDQVAAAVLLQSWLDGAAGRARTGREGPGGDDGEE
jgi:putative Holliday junction resolvase